jgi:hypothetical protein
LPIGSADHSPFQPALPGHTFPKLHPFLKLAAKRAQRCSGCGKLELASLSGLGGQELVLPVIGKLPGNAHVQARAPYVHLAAEAVEMAADVIAQNLLQSSGGSQATPSLSD